MKFFDRFIYALYRRRKMLGIMLFIFLLVMPAIAHGQAAATKKTEDEYLQEFQQGLGVWLRFMSALFWPILIIIGGLFDNNLIFDGKMGEALLEIWVQVRNVVNVIFVVLLLLIALYNVLGLGENGPEALKPLQLKTALPKFVIALIVVNFSYLGAKVVLDFTNVLTTAVITLPTKIETAQNQFNQMKIESERIICEPGSPLYGVFCRAKSPTPGAAAPTTAQREFNERGKNFFSRIDRNNLAMAMAMQFGSLQYQTRIRDDIKDLAQLTFNIIFSLLLYIVFALSYIALFIVLVVRLPVLWLMIAFSPLAGAAMVLPSISKLGGEGGNFGEKFVKHAIAPVIAGAALSVGYIMLTAMKSDPGISGGYYAISILDVDPNALLNQIDDLQEFLMAAAVIFVVWTGVFASAKGTMAEFATEKIRSGAQDWGKFIAKLPLYAQVIPIKGKGKAGVSNIFAGIEAMKRKIQTEGNMPFTEMPSDSEKQLMKVHSAPDLVTLLHEQPGLLLTPKQDLYQRQIIDVLKRIEGVQENPHDKQALERLQGLSGEERLRGLHELRRTAATPELQRTLEGFVDSDFGAFKNKVNEDAPRRLGTTPEGGETPAAGAAAGTTNRIGEKSELRQEAVFKAFEAAAENFANRGIFVGLDGEQVKQVRNRLQSITPADRTDDAIQQIIDEVRGRPAPVPQAAATPGTSQTPPAPGAPVLPPGTVISQPEPPEE